MSLREAPSPTVRSADARPVAPDFPVTLQRSQRAYLATLSKSDAARVRRNAVLVELHEAGWSYAALARTLGVSPQRVGALVTETQRVGDANDEN